MVAIAWNGLFFLAALKTQSQQAVPGLQPLFMPIIMFSTFFAPTDGAPRWFRIAAAANPFTHLIDGTRSILRAGTDIADLAIGTSAFAAIGIVTYATTARIFRGLTRPDTEPATTGPSHTA